MSSGARAAGTLDGAVSSAIGWIGATGAAMGAGAGMGEFCVSPSQRPTQWMDPPRAISRSGLSAELATRSSDHWNSEACECSEQSGVAPPLAVSSRSVTGLPFF